MWKLNRKHYENQDESVSKTDNGVTIVILTSSDEYLKWLEEGNTPLPADEPNEGTE